MQPKFVKIVMAYPGASTDQILPTENYIERKLVIMQGKGFDGEIATLQHKGLKEEEQVHGFTVKRFRNTLSLLWHLFSDRQITIVHSFLRPFPPSLLAGLLFNKRRIITPSTYILGSNAPIRAVSRFLMKRFNKVIAQTPYERDIYLKEGFLPEQIALLPCAIDFEFFSKQTIPDRKALAAKYQFDQNDFLICTVSNVRKFKNIEVILKAFQLFHAKHPQSHFILAGKDMLQSDMFLEQRKQQGPTSVREIITSLHLEDCATVTGSLTTEEVREVHHLSQIFANSSDPEAQGIAAYEAAASGLPLCLSAIGSFTTVFKDNALYHAPKDAAMLAENFERYYQDSPLRKKNAAAIQEMVREWDYKILEKKFSQLYDEVLAGTP